MPANDREVFEYFQRDDDTISEVELLAYASYALDKYEWMKKFEELHGTSPTQAEIDDWINHLPDSRLEETFDQALSFFDTAAREFLKDEIDTATKKAVDDSILSEVKRHTSFRSTWLLNVFCGIVASLAFSLLVIVMSLIFSHDPSPIALFKTIEQTAGKNPPKGP
jgi:hypothetical protein